MLGCYARVTLQRLPPLRPLIITDVNIIARIMLLSLNKVVVILIMGAIQYIEIGTVEADAPHIARGHEKILRALQCDL